MRTVIEREIARTEASIKSTEHMAETLRTRIERQVIDGGHDALAELFMARIIKAAYRESLLRELGSEMR